MNEESNSILRAVANEAVKLVKGLNKTGKYIANGVVILVLIGIGLYVLL